MKIAVNNEFQILNKEIESYPEHGKMVKTNVCLRFPHEFSNPHSYQGKYYTNYPKNNTNNIALWLINFLKETPFNEYIETDETELNNNLKNIEIYTETLGFLLENILKTYKCPYLINDKSFNIIYQSDTLPNWQELPSKVLSIILYYKKLLNIDTLTFQDNPKLGITAGNPYLDFEGVVFAPKTANQLTTDHYPKYYDIVEVFEDIILTDYTIIPSDNYVRPIGGLYKYV